MEDAAAIRRLRVAGAIAVITLALLTIASASFLAWRHSTGAARTELINRSGLRRGQSVAVLYRAERIIRYPSEVAQLNAAIAKLDASQAGLRDLSRVNDAFFQRFMATAREVAAHPQDPAFRDSLDGLGDRMYQIFYDRTIEYSDRAGEQRTRSFDTTMAGSAATLIALVLLYAFVLRPSERFVGKSVDELVRSRERLRSLYRIASSPDLTATQIDEALALGAKTLGMEFGFVSEIVEGMATIRHRLGPDNLLPLDETFTSLLIGQAIVTSQHALSIDDLTGVSYSAQLEEQGLRWKSCIGSRLMVDSSVYGLLVFFRRDVAKPGFEETDRDFIDLMAAFIGAAIGRMRLQSTLSEMAFHDPVTGLANRAMLEEHLRRAISQAKRFHESVAVHYLDLNKFKPVNDEYGHAAGDLVLREAARRFRGVVRAHDVVARIGGDEFVVLQTDARDGAMTDQLAHRLRQCMKASIALADGTPVSVGVSVGFAVFPHDASDAPGLLRAADAAMYKHKGMKVR